MNITPIYSFHSDDGRSQSVRIVMKSGQPWFAAPDVCAALGVGNVSMATSRLDDDEKGVSTVDTPGGPQSMTIINESGLYSLILGGRKQEAKRFKRWVTADVLPSIRRTGAYAQPAADPMQVLNDPAAMRGLLLGYTEKVLELQSQVGELTPKAQALDLIAASTEALTITQAAKVLGTKVAALTSLLHTRGWVYRQNNSWVAYQGHIQSGDLEYKEARYTDDNGMAAARPYCHVTPKGMTKLAKMLGSPQSQLALQ